MPNFARRASLATVALLVLVSVTMAQRPGRSNRSFYVSNVVLKDSTPVTWRTVTPANAGLDAKKLDAASKKFSLHPRARSFLVVRKGALVWERYFHGAKPTESCNVHSVSKSLLGALVGIAVKRGDLSGTDHLVAKTFGKYQPESPESRRTLSVEHLLTMTMGLKWEEDVTEYRIQRRPNWVKAILSLDQAETPGEKFFYTTGSTHVLSALLTEATGSSTHDYAKKRLLQPLGITVDRWGAPDPQGYDSGGCNVFRTPRELARFGQLFLQRGKWKKKQLIPSDWIEKSWRPHQKIDSIYQYGYLWWLLQLGDIKVAVAWGYGNQFVFVIPKLDMVAVITSDSHGELRGERIKPHTFAKEWLLEAVSEGR